MKVREVLRKQPRTGSWWDLKLDQLGTNRRGGREALQRELPKVMRDAVEDDAIFLDGFINRE